MPDEYVDPFTGGLILNHVDFRLPGNGGLDLVIQRTFNSKNVWRECWFTGSTCSCDKGENTWLGYGWTLHFGRLFKSTNININPFIEMPDGSIHTAYRKTGLEYITKDYWLLDGTSNVLTLTNGTKIYFVQLGPQHPGYLQHNVYYATKIQDINGNTIDIFYRSSNGSSRSNIISYVLDSGGRRIDFTTSTINGAARLTSISGPGVSISYTHQPQTTWSDTILTKANLPVGNPWEYTYDGQELKSVKSPYGGMVTYTYGCYSVNACGKIFTCKRVARKSTSGRNIPSGTWTFSYFQGTNNEYTQISDPCGRTIKYSYYGYGSVSNGSTWKIGLPKSKEIVGEETITYNWINSSYISIDDYILRYCGFDHEIYVPLLTSKSITRGGKTYATNYSNYDSYGNPKTISESGDKSRTTTKTYWYNTSKNIVQDKPSSETVSGGFSGTFKTNYFYDSNGNLTQLNKYGVVTNYSYYSNGNLYSITDANGKTTYYQWSNGRISKVTNPVYSISRSINSNGTIASETNGRGYTTNYTYDGNLRLTKIQPPVGNPTYFAYLSDNSYKKETRGGYYIYYYYDGFGRTSGTYDSKGVDTDIIYKSCGPKNYTTSNIGDTVYYDNFGRTRESVHKDSTKITYSYSGSNITVTDEAGNKTYLTYNAFGNPDEKFLVSVKDALNNTTTYGRNILGSLTG
ncbi:MAG: RHS repeat protein, partial [Nitrospira sp.]|nr:RHS repeat protein [Nitrospira sp.]